MDRAAGTSALLIPSTPAGEGSSVLTRILRGGGSASRERVFSKQTLLPLRFVSQTSPPSPARGEGKYSGSAARGDTARCHIPVSRCQTAQRIPAARLRPGRETCRHPSRGGRSAERRIVSLSRLRGATRPITRDARLSALHRGGFWAPGPRFRLRHCLRSACSELLAAQVLVPGGRIPVPPEHRGYEPQPQDATPRSANGTVSGDAPR
jgi:hypothetical protein